MVSNTVTILAAACSPKCDNNDYSLSLCSACSLRAARKLLRCGTVFLFFFQAEDGIRDLTVTGVQTCALPISAVEAVHYPALESHPGHEIAKRQMSDFGGMLSFRLRAGREAAIALTGKLNVFKTATSLGGVESLIEHRASSEGVGSTTPQNLLRVSVGLEHPDDLIDDLRQAL